VPQSGRERNNPNNALGLELHCHRPWSFTGRRATKVIFILQMTYWARQQVLASSPSDTTSVIATRQTAPRHLFYARPIVQLGLRLGQGSLDPHGGLLHFYSACRTLTAVLRTSTGLSLAQQPLLLPPPELVWTQVRICTLIWSRHTSLTAYYWLHLTADLRWPVVEKVRVIVEDGWIV